jgi:hypothetical protein
MDPLVEPLPSFCKQAAEFSMSLKIGGYCKRSSKMYIGKRVRRSHEFGEIPEMSAL